MGATTYLVGTFVLILGLSAGMVYVVLKFILEMDTRVVLLGTPASAFGFCLRKICAFV